MQDIKTKKPGFFKSGTPWVWLNAGAVSASIIMVVGLLILIAVRGLGHFWPKTVWEIEYHEYGDTIVLLGERSKVETVPSSQLQSSGRTYNFDQEFVERTLLKTGNRDVFGFDFKLIVEPNQIKERKPKDAIVFERTQWGNFYGYLQTIREQGNKLSINSSMLWSELKQRINRVDKLRERIHEIEKEDIGAINYKIEKLRLRQRKIELLGSLDKIELDEIVAQKAGLDEEYAVLKQELDSLYADIKRDSVEYARS